MLIISRPNLIWIVALGPPIGCSRAAKADSSEQWGPVAAGQCSRARPDQVEVAGADPKRAQVCATQICLRYGHADPHALLLANLCVIHQHVWLLLSRASRFLLANGTSSCHSLNKPAPLQMSHIAKLARTFSSPCSRTSSRASSPTCKASSDFLKASLPTPRASKSGLPLSGRSASLHNTLMLTTRKTSYVPAELLQHAQLLRPFFSEILPASPSLDDQRYWSVC